MRNNALIGVPPGFFVSPGQLLCIVTDGGSDLCSWGHDSAQYTHLSTLMTPHKPNGLCFMVDIQEFTS